jgi:hypothetical protein
MVMENAVATELVYTGVVDGVFTRTVLGDKFRPTKKNKYQWALRCTSVKR